MQPNRNETKTSDEHPLPGDECGEQAGEPDPGAEVGDELVVAEVAAGKHGASGETGEAARDEHRADAVTALGDSRAVGGLRVAAEHSQAETDDGVVEDHPDDDA